ncbi:MAG: phosphopantothenoylcysteine decarboxylase, partial [Leptospiraceae bacterium]|nr:phosphopantothenoylcysteine decarboxylase [Leptospiraceae bacterium]
GANNIDVISTDDMLAGVLSQLRENCTLIMAAAPADYKPLKKSEVKIKKTESPSLDLVPNPDILKTVGKHAKDKNIPVTLIGFAAETHSVEEYAKKKLKEKDLDMIFLNDLSRSDSGFGVDTNHLTVFRRDGTREEWPLAGKERLGYMIIHEIEKYRTSSAAK